MLHQKSPICRTLQLFLSLGLLLSARSTEVIDSEVIVSEEHPRGCVVYGNCGGLPCVNETDAQPFATEGGSYQIIKEICPHLETESTFCCDDEQAKIMKEKLKAADKRLKSCPTARDNFRAMVCDMTCSPYQGGYVEVVEEEGSSAKKLKYFLSWEYADKVWRSIHPTDHFICGNVIKRCSKEDLFGFIGDNKWTKLKTQYVWGDENLRSPCADNVKCTSKGSNSCTEC